jgi:hypothetical protein
MNSINYLSKYYIIYKISYTKYMYLLQNIKYSIYIPCQSKYCFKIFRYRGTNNKSNKISHVKVNVPATAAALNSIYVVIRALKPNTIFR